MYSSYEELRNARSRVSLRSPSTGSLLSHSPSTGSMQSAQWEQHVKMTTLRNEKIRLQSEASKLRAAFVAQDARLTGAIPAYMLKACLKAGGSELPDSEMRAIFGRFKTSDGHFAWLRFCESLEKGRGDEVSFHPKTLSRPVSASDLSASSLSGRGGTVSANFLASKMSRRSLAPSASVGSLPGTPGGNSSKVNRMRRMVSEASQIAEATLKSQKEARVQQLTEWYSKQEATKMPPRPSTVMAAPASMTMYATSEPEYEYEPEPVAPMPVAPKRDLDAEFAEKQKLKNLMSMAEEGLNSRFSDMYKAFQHVDLDRSGRLSKKEISRALDMWNIPLTDADLDMIIADCDADGDGGIGYEEFVDKLARGTVSSAAMGKRGMQSKEAMGVDSQEALAHQLGHVKQKKFIPTLNSSGGAEQRPATPSDIQQVYGMPGKGGQPTAVAAPKRDIHADYAEEQELKKVLAMAEEGLNSRFSDMFKAFQYVDLDRSGRLSKKEISRALDMWNVPIPDHLLDRLMQSCDQDDDGGVSYEEFVDKLARGTVSNAAMGTHVLFSGARLEQLRKRIVELEAENRGERANFKELHRVRSRLERIKVQREAQIAALVAKCEDLQMLKFGQLIKLELLDQDSQANKGEEELTLKIEALEGQHVSQLAALERKQKRAKETLLSVTQENTECLAQIAELSARQFQLEKELNSSGAGVAVADAGPTIRQEVEERNRLVALVKLQAKEIDALKAEINLLRRKGGHVYTPALLPPQPVATDDIPTMASVTPGLDVAAMDADNLPGPPMA